MKTKAEIVEYLKSKGIYMSGKIIMKTADHSENPLAPEKYCYKVYFSDCLGRRKGLSVWPETVGYQGI